MLEEREANGLTMQGQHLNSQTVDLARNLRENQLGGVIFGCKHNTIEECFEKQLFGLSNLPFTSCFEHMCHFSHLYNLVIDSVMFVLYMHYYPLQSWCNCGVCEVKTS